MLVLIFPLHFAFGQIVEYSLPEEKAPNTYIGNVALDANISGLAQTEDLLNMEYRILSQSNPYAELFSINEKDANLYTAKQIDRTNESMHFFNFFAIDVNSFLQNHASPNRLSKNSFFLPSTGEIYLKPEFSAWDFSQKQKTKRMQ